MRHELCSSLADLLKSQNNLGLIMLTRIKQSLMSSILSVGSKAQVFRGTAVKTSGGLRKDDLMRNRHGRIISKKKHAQGIAAFKRNNLKPKTAEELAAIRPKR